RSLFFCLMKQSKTYKIKMINMLKPIILLLLIFVSFTDYAQSDADSRFDHSTDLLLANYDCKTEVDDLHSAVAFATLLSHPDYDDIRYHAVAGAYGIQEGLYVPPNELFNLAFGDHWSDAHADWDGAVNEVLDVAKNTLNSGGNIWIADAGQSDFSADLIAAIKDGIPQTNLAGRIHIVQHSDWNEEVTSADDLEYAKTYAIYHKIPDGNAVDNGTPGFRSPDFNSWEKYISSDHLRSVWQLAIDLGNKYNGKEGRYLTEAVEDGGVDFSDMSEICWMLGLEDIRDAEEFFERFGD
ncbi:MAG: hypothetical protein P8X57_15430, partial [Cyclobacteriaceae bacterium]